MQIGFLGGSVAVLLIVVGLLSGSLSVLREIQVMYLPTRASEQKTFWGFVRIAFVIAAVLLWFNEHAKVSKLLAGPSAYLETSINASYFGEDHHPILFAINQPIFIKVTWTRTGTGLALHAAGLARTYLAKDATISSQRSVVDQFQKAWDGKLAEQSKKGSEGTTLGYSDDSKSIWTSTQRDGPIFGDTLRPQLWDGSRILFVVAAVRYTAETSLRKYDSHYCTMLQPLNENDPVNKGKPMPKEYQVSVTWQICDIYTSPTPVP